MARRTINDLYLIGGPAGFYAGQARRMAKGGWERRIAEHRRGKGNYRAKQLLISGITACHVASVVAERGFVNLLEARLWDALVARGWRPVHPRPQESELWTPIGSFCGRKHTPESRALMSKRARGRQPWNAGKKLSIEHRAKLSTVHRGQPAPNRGKKASAKTRAKLSAIHSNRSVEWRARISAGRRGIAPWNKGKNLSREMCVHIAAAKRGRRLSKAHRAAISAGVRAARRVVRCR